MNTRTLAQRPPLFLAGLLLAGTLSACSAASPSAPTQVVVTEAPAATVVATAAPQSTAEPAATEAAQSTTAPSATEASQPTTAPAATEAAQPTTAATAAVVTMTRINLNTATADQILAVPNTGQRMVREFQEYQPYTSIEQFRREIGKYVDAATVAGFEQYVYVPVDPNQADAATLQQIPGVTAELANALIAARPFASGDAFLAKLGETLSADQVAVAQAYLQ